MTTQDNRVRDCKCPRARHVHGTNAAYTRDACRCDPCRKAGMAWQKRYRLATIRGTSNKLIDAEPARRHIHHLMNGYGASQKGIAAAADVSQTVLRRLLDGQEKISRDVADKVLAVDLDCLPDTATILARGVVRRMEALATRGHCAHLIYRQTGVQVQTIALGWEKSGGVGRGSTVTMAVHRRVDDYYQQHAFAPVLEGATPGEKKGVTYALTRAATAGWVPPAAWDDIDLDPAPATTVGEGPRVDVDDVRHLLAAGRSTHDIAARLRRDWPEIQAALDGSGDTVLARIASTRREADVEARRRESNARTHQKAAA